MQRKAGQLLTALGILLPVAVGIVTNVATADLPPWLMHRLWLAWIVLAVLSGLLLVLGTFQERDPTPPGLFSAMTPLVRACWSHVVLFQKFSIMVGLWWCITPLFFPDHLYGQIRATNLRAITVELLNVFGTPIQDGPRVDIDDQDGAFVLAYTRAVGRHPWSVRIVAPGCRARMYPIPYFWGRAPLSLTFVCVAGGQE